LAWSESSRRLSETRASMDSPDWSADVQEALWEAGRAYGRRLEVAEQVAVTRVLARGGRHQVTTEEVKGAFAEAGLLRPSSAFAKDVVSRLGKLPSPRRSLRQVLLDYRRFAVDALSAQFGGRTTGNEEGLRNNLLTYLPQHGYAEARTGRGRTDVLIPPPTDAIIEVKIWTTAGAYRDGLEELGRYILTTQPKEAFMVVFGDREPLPSVIASHGQAIAEEVELEGVVVPVIVVAFEVDAPSKAARETRRRTRSGR
jgi:hypothetical protein